MGTTVEEKVLDIKVRYEDAIRGIAKYRTELDVLKKVEATLKDDVENNRITREQYNVKLTESKLAANEYKEAIRGLEKETQNNIKAEKEQQGSLVSLRGSLSNLTKQYDEMSEAERQSASGQDLAIHINAITDKLKGAEEGTQRFYRNVGNYEEAFSKALAPMKTKLDEMTTAYMNMSKEERQGAKGDEMRQHMQDMKDEITATSEAGGKFQNELLSMAGVQGGLLGSITNMVGGLNSMSKAFSAGKAAAMAFGKQMLALLLNPVVLAIAAVVLVLAALKSGFDKVNQTIKGSEELNAKYSSAMALNSVVSDRLTNVNEKIAATYIKIVEWVSKAIATVTDWIGITENASGAVEQYSQLEKDRYKLAVETRKANEAAAENELKVSDLRNKVAQKDKYTHKERIAFLDEAIKVETSTAKKKQEIATENLRLLEEEGKRTMNSAEFEEKLSQARINLTRATTDLNNKTREMSAQRSEAINADKAAEKARLDAAKTAAKEAASIAKERRDKEREAVRAAEDAMLALVKDGIEKQRKETMLSYDRQIEDLKTKLATEKNLTVNAKKALNDNIKALEERRTQDLKALSDEELAQNIEKEQKRIELMLSAVKSGSEQEYQLKLQSMQKQMEAELANAKLTEEQKALIRDKYRIQEDTLIDEHTNSVNQKQLNAMNLEYETKIAQAYGNEQAILQIKMEQKKAELDQLQQMEGESMEAFNLRKLKIGNEYADAKKDVADKEVEIEHAKQQSMADITDSLIGLTEQLGESDKGFAVASKVLALAQIAINTGLAIAKMVSAESGKGIVGIATMAAGIAAIVSNIAAAIKTVKSAKFATGGLVTGEGSGTSDSIPAQLSNGESVMTAATTSMFAPMLSAFNTMGGGIPINITANSSQTIGEDMLARAIAKGFMMAPAPVLSVQEFTSVANRIKYVESIGDI